MTTPLTQDQIDSGIPSVMDHTSKVIASINSPTQVRKKTLYSCDSDIIGRQSI